MTALLLGRNTCHYLQAVRQSARARARLRFVLKLLVALHQPLADLVLHVADATRVALG